MACKYMFPIIYLQNKLDYSKKILFGFSLTMSYKDFLKYKKILEKKVKNREPDEDDIYVIDDFITRNIINGWLNKFSPITFYDCVVVAKEEAEFEKISTETQGLPLEVANRMIENVVGTFQLPLGIATNFTINDKDYTLEQLLQIWNAL